MVKAAAKAAVRDFPVKTSCSPGLPSQEGVLGQRMCRDLPHMYRKPLVSLTGSKRLQSRRSISSESVVLDRKGHCLPGDTGRSLETPAVVTVGRGGT